MRPLPLPLPLLQPSVLALAMLAAVAPALAEDARTPAEKNQLETVTITAERRVENIKDVPNAVSAISGEKLEVLNSSGLDVRFLSGRVPSLNIESSFGRSFPRFYIRGYGNTDFRLNASQPVSVVHDDVVQENAILKGFPVFDLQAVEVIAGPQGTLFGRNTPAGVVKFDSVRPSQRREGHLNATYGNLGTINVDGAFNLPMSGDWAARLSAQVQHRRDWIGNQNPAGTQQTGGHDDRAARLQVLYEPHKEFSALLNLHNRELDGSPRGFRSSIIKPGTNDLVDGFDPAKVYLDGTLEQRVHATGANLRLKWALDDVTLHSISGIETVQPFSRSDVDGGYRLHVVPGPDFRRPPYEREGDVFFKVETSDGLRDHRQLSHELRLESTGVAPLRWQAGVYLFDERYTMVSTDYVPTPNPVITSHQTNRAWAVFGSLGYAPSAALDLRAGLRYTRDRKTLSTVGTVNTAAGTSAATDDRKISWDLAGTWKLDRETNLYARVATGFRGASIYPASALGAQTQARPETVTSFEFGAKSEFWNRRARLAATAFAFKVKDQQLTAVGSTSNTNRLLNATKASGQGIELNLDMLPTDRLLLTLGGSFNDTKIKDPGLFEVQLGSGATMLGTPDAQGRYSLYGNPLPNAPKWIGHMTARWGIPTPAGNEFYVYTDWAYRSRVNFFLSRSIEFTGKSLLEGGLRGGYVWGNGRYEAALFVRNVTNQIRVTGAIAFNNLTGFINEPRTYGAQFKALF